MFDCIVRWGDCVRSLNFDDIRSDKSILDNIRFLNITPEKYLSQCMINSQEDFKNYLRRIKGDAGYYFYINVWDCRARLALMQVKPDGRGVSIRADFGRFDVGDDLSREFESAMLDAIVEAGGSINWSGHYPLNHFLENLLKSRLWSGRYKRN